MSAKKVQFGSAPQARPAPAADPEQWVATRTTEEKQKRMTFDVPESLHRRVKAGCAQRGVPIREVILELLAREFPE